MRIFTIIISFILSFSLISCSPKSNDNGSEKNIETNYYTETDLSLPDQYEFTSILNVSESKPGTLDIIASTKKESALLFHYNMDTQEWSKPNPLVSPENTLVMNAIPLNNGSYYIECLPNESLDMEYYIIDSKGVLQQLTITDYPNNSEETISLHGLFATDKGILCTTSDGIENYYLLDSQTGRILVDFNKNSMRSDSQAFYIDDFLIILSTNGETEVIETYQLETGEKTENNKIMEKFLFERVNSLFLPSPSAHDVIRLNSEGITSLSIDTGEKTELLNSKSMKYSQEDTSLYGAYVCQNQNIVTWQQSTTELFDWSLSLFTYSDIGKKEECTTLNVYMLYDDIIPDYLYSQFENKHPNIKLNLQYGSTDTSAITAEDAIKILNTELSAGKGPDIILLDGLPVASYISKEILEPVDELLKDLPSNSYFKNMIHCYSTEDVTYALPMGFTIPSILSTETVLNKDSSFESFTSEVETLSGKMILPKSVYGNLVSTLYDVYFDSCFKNGFVDQAALKAFFLNCEKLWNVSSYHESDEPSDFKYSEKVNTSISVPLIYAAFANSQVTIGNTSTLMSFHGLKGLSQSHSLQWDILGTTFTPKYSYGITAKSEHTEEAMEFLQFILSEGQSYIVDKQLALPIKKDLIIQDLSDEKKSEFIGLGNISSDELVEIPAPKFEETECKTLIEKIEHAKLLQYSNPEMKTLTLSTLASYLNQEITLDYAVSSTLNKVNIMLKE